MILINKGVSNTFDLTLTEKVTFANPYFLFVFRNDVTKDYQRKVIGDDSLYTSRYNRFVIVEGTDVTFDPTGYWHYWVYAQTSQTNTDENLSTVLVETGKVHVEGTATTHSTHSTTRTYKTHGTGAT